VFPKIAGLTTVAVAAVCLLAPIPSSGVERLYSLSVYPVIQHMVTPVTNLLPFALLDALILLTIGLVVRAALRAFRVARRKRSAMPVLRYAWGLIVAGAVLYLVFLAIWGFNYRRAPMARRLVVTEKAPDRMAVLALGHQAVTQINQLYAEAHQAGWPREEWRDNALRVAFAQTQRLLTDARPAEPGRVKATLLGFYFRWSSVDGMVNPFGLEVLANPDLLPWERPFVAAHEWSHLAGYAHEDEANFVGWLTCMRGPAPVQYSGWLFLYWEVLGQLRAADRAELSMSLAPGPQRDLDAINERLRRDQFPFLRNVSWRVYDSYLKANRVDEGVRSYSEVINLILRVRFDDGWIPVRRDDHRRAP
jgi:hypothetical protein